MVNLLVVSMATTDNMFVWGKYMQDIFLHRFRGYCGENAACKINKIILRGSDNTRAWSNMSASFSFFFSFVFSLI